jgi:hypothetical protein
VIVNRTVVAIVPRGEVRSFFEQLRRPGNEDGEECTGGSDGIRTRDLSLDRAAC